MLDRMARTSAGARSAIGRAGLALLLAAVLPAAAAPRAWSAGTAVTQAPADPAATADATFGFTSDDPLATFECRLDGEPFTSCATPQAYAGLTEGEHAFEVRALDALLEPDPTPALFTWTVDLTAPPTSVAGGPASPTNRTAAVLSFSSADPGAGFECSLDGAAYATCTSPATLAGPLADGGHTFLVRARDAAGNADDTPAAWVWTVDTSVPHTTLGAVPGDPTNQTSAGFTFSSPDGGIAFECRLDGAAFAPCVSGAAHSGLAAGPHTFEVRAIDAAGNVESPPAAHTWTVDLTPPTTSIDGGPSGPTNDDSPAFAFSSPSDPLAAFECRLDGAAWAACLSPAGHTGLPDGEHTVAVRAVDAAGNADASPATRTFTVDTQAPDTSLGATPAVLSNEDAATFAFTSADPLASFACRVDGGDWTACGSPRELSSLSEGAHTFEVRAQDAAGNADATPAAFGWTIDLTAPDTGIDSGPSGPVPDPSPGFTFSSGDGAATFECRLDGGAFAPCASPLTTPPLADGPHTLDVRARDPAGNADGTPARRSFSVDTVAPPTTLGATPADPSGSVSASFTFSSADGGATFECRLDGSSWAACSPPAAYPALDEGPHTFDVRARDAVGNADATPASFTWTVDLTPPDTQLGSVPPDPSGSATASFVFTSADGSASFECRLDGGVFAPCAPGQTYTGLAEGGHLFEVRARDPAGNADPLPASHGWTVDTVAPETSITSGPSGPTSDATPSLTFSSPDAAATVECRVDAGAWAACTSPLTTAPLADGAHTFQARARDAAGNVDASPAARAFTVDTAAPETEITSGPSGPVNDATPSASFTSPDPTAVFECRVDGGPWTGCTSPLTSAVLPEGAHTFEVRAIDPAGNVDATPAARGFTVDVTAPDTSITAAPASPVNQTTAGFSFAGDEPGATFECRLDAGAWAACGSGVEYGGLPAGVHTFSVRALDPAGNRDGSPDVHTWTVDLTAPGTTITGGPPDPSSSTSATFTFTSPDAGASFECSLDGAAFGGCSSGVVLTGLAPGAHTFRVRARDPAGNADPTPDSRTWAVDTSPPPTSLDSAPATPANTAAASFTFSSEDPGAAFECRLDGGSWSACASPTSYGGLAEGGHTFEVRAVDAAGNADATPPVHAWTVDLTAPDTAITAGPSGATSDATPSLAFSSADAGAAFECRMDSGAWAPCTSPLTSAALADGTHTFQVRARDAAGNVDASPASRAFAVDTVAPATSAIGGPAGPSASTSASLTFSSPDASATFECRLDGAAWAACTSPHALSALAEGAHTLDVRARDAAGNTDATPSAHTWTVDLTAPDTSVTSGPSGPTNLAAPAFAFSSADATATFECRLDGGAWAPCTSPKAYASLAAGSHAFEVRAKDAAGNADASPASRSFTVDLTAPDTTLGPGAPAGTVASSSATLAFSSADATATFECRLDGGAWAPCTSPKTFTGLADGDHTAAIRARDPAGNLDATPVSHGWSVDTTPPETQMGPAPASPTASTSASVTFSSAELGGTFECRLDGGAWTACDSPKAYTSLAEGSHTAEVRAKDPLGNADATPGAVTWAVDTTAPETTLGPDPPGLELNVSPAFTFSSADPAASFECRLDGGAFAGCASPQAYAGLGDGEHTFEVRARDAAGNTDATAAARTWFLDGTAPNTVIAGAPNGTTGSGSALIAFHSADFEASFECRLDGDPWASCESPVELGGLGSGLHLFRVRSKDAVGNVDLTPAERGWKVQPGWAGAVGVSGSVRPHATISMLSPGAAVTPGAPLAASVRTGAVAGPVSITAEPEPDGVAGFSLLGGRLEIIAPEGTAADPLHITLHADASLLPAGNGAGDADVLRDGARVAPCRAPTVADPDPCVASRSIDGGTGDLVIVVHSSRASRWQFGIADPPPPASPAAAPAAAAGPAAAGAAVRAPARACRVPRLTGMTVAAARRRLARQGCRLGAIRRRVQRKGTAGRIAAQTVKAGRRLTAGTRVGVSVIRRR
jgi:hypothetical protein